jgi:hypothetical protein
MKRILQNNHKKWECDMTKDSNKLKIHLEHVVEAFKSTKNCEMATPPIIVECSL